MDPKLQKGLLRWLTKRHEGFCLGMVCAPIEEERVWENWSITRLYQKGVTKEKANELLETVEGKEAMKAFQDRYEWYQDLIEEKVFFDFFQEKMHRGKFHKRECIGLTSHEFRGTENYLEWLEELFYTCAGLPEYELWEPMRDTNRDFIHRTVGRYCRKIVKLPWFDL